MPCRKDWVVLDGLNYIKDRLDGTLSYRWSCRMGICGSCGMIVNGEPKLTCATFLTDYAPGTGPRRAAANFPVIRDLVVEIGDFMRKLREGQAVDHPRREEKPLSEGEYLQTPEQLDDYKQFSMCINCMLCYAACPVYGLDPKFIGPAAIALAQRYNLDSRDEGAQRAPAGPLGARGHLGLHLRRRMHARSVPSTSIPPAPSSATSSTASMEWLKSLLHATGRAMSERTRLHGVSPPLDRIRVSTYWWLQRGSYSGVHPARAEQHLRRPGS